MVLQVLFSTWQSQLLSYSMVCGEVAGAYGTYSPSGSTSVSDPDLNTDQPGSETLGIAISGARCWSPFCSNRYSVIWSRRCSPYVVYFPLQVSMWQHQFYIVHSCVGLFSWGIGMFWGCRCCNRCGSTSNMWHFSLELCYCFAGVVLHVAIPVL